MRVKSRPRFYIETENGDLALARDDEILYWALTLIHDKKLVEAVVMFRDRLPEPDEVSEDEWVEACRKATKKLSMDQVEVQNELFGFSSRDGKLEFRVRLSSAPRRPQLAASGRTELASLTHKCSAQEPI